MSRLAFLAALGLLAAIALGHAGRVPQLLDAVAAFRLHLAALAALIALGALLARRYRPAALFALVALVGVVTTPHLFTPEARAPAPGPTRPLSVLLANVFKYNDDVPRVAETLAAPGADVIVTLETQRSMLHEPALAPWPYRRLEFGEKPTGVVIWSRTPFLPPDLFAHGNVHPSLLLARLPMPEGPPLQIAAIHLSRPVTHPQEWELLDFHRFWRRFAAPTVLVGDFNAAPWSHAVRHVARISRTEPFGGVRPSWAGVLGLPIDHVLASPGIGAESLETLPIPGSDHRAVLAHLLIPLTWP